MDGLKRGSAAIVGVAESDIGQVAEGFSVVDLMAQGTKRALDDCGLALKDVDGLFSATAQSRLSVLALAEYLGIDPAYLGSTIVGGSSFEYHVAHAMGAIAQGLCSVAVIAYGTHGIGEAVFIARTYSRDVTLLTLGQPLELNPEQRAKLEGHQVKIVETPVESLDMEEDRISAVSLGISRASLSIAPRPARAGQIQGRQPQPCEEYSSMRERIESASSFFGSIASAWLTVFSAPW